MGLTKEEKLAAIEAKRGPLLHEQYAAELDVKVAAKGPEELAAEPQKRLDEINAKLEVLDNEEKALG